ncbi:MAG: ABC transporter permease [bacterium]
MMNNSLQSKKVKKNVLNISKFTFLGLVLFFTYFPLLIIALLSFNTDNSGNDFTGLTLEWYSKMFQDDNLMSAIKNTLLIAILSTLISTILGTLTAIGINAINKKYKKYLIFLNNVPIINADIVTGIFLLILFTILGNIIGIRLLGFNTLLIAHVLFSTPYVVLSVLPKLNELDKNLFDAALDLGCTPYYALRKIIVPSIKSGIFAGMFFAFTMSIDDFVISYFVSGVEIENFSIWLYGSLKITKNDPWPKACAYNTLIMFITIFGVGIYTYIQHKKKGKKI